LNSGSFGASSGRQWHGAKVNPKFNVAIAGAAVPALWAPKCSPGRQTVHFTRTLYLLGPADDGTITMAGFSRTRTAFGGVPVPFSRMELRINGQVAYSTTNPSGGSGQLRPAGLAAIRFGPNQFEVVVSKRATGPCNGKHSHQYAVEFDFSGAFHSDVSGSVGQNDGTGQCGTGSCSGKTTIPFTLTNKGPATMLEPTLIMNWTFRSDNEVPSEGPYSFRGDAGATCTTKQIDPRHYNVICEGSPFAGNAFAALHVSFDYETSGYDSSGNKRETWTYDWHFPGAYSRGIAASGTGMVTICSPPGPSCAKPVS
jgi:hypothetical protein